MMKQLRTSSLITRRAVLKRRDAKRFAAVTGQCENRLRESGREHWRERGVAILTVLALLSVFGLILISFTYSLRLEQLATESYSQTAKVQELSEAGKEAVRSKLETLDASIASRHVLGRTSARSVSLYDDAFQGIALQSRMEGNLDAQRSRHMVGPGGKIVSQIVTRGGSSRYVPPSSVGVDEDPRGDMTAANNEWFYPNAKGDAKPGVAGSDDDGDLKIDEGDPGDDDEDGLVDEDGLDRYFDGGRIPQGFGFDTDDDARGVFDDSGKIDLNWAGNLSRNGQYSYGDGVTPFELDLAVFLGAVFKAREGGLVNGSPAMPIINLDAEQIATEIVNLRLGGDKQPGTLQDDDNDGNAVEILKVETLASQFTGLATYKNIRPVVIVGDGEDNDLDNLKDEESEIYIGPSSVGGQPLSDGDAIGFDIARSDSDVMDFRPGDRVDNDGDGTADEKDEGLNEPDEFNPLRPTGDDRPFETLEDLKLLPSLQGASASKTLLQDAVLRRLKLLATVYSEADQVAPALSGPEADYVRINPNFTNPWTANPTEESRTQLAVSPLLDIEALYPLQVDNDGDWQAAREGALRGVVGAHADRKDNDGDGFIDEPSDDWDNNLWPSGDFDGGRESDQSAPAYIGGGRDSDRDGTLDDANVSNSDMLHGGLIRIGDYKDGSVENRPRRPRDEKDLFAGFVQQSDGHDNDGDSLIDDDGDFNGDGIDSYDPEYHVNDDPEGDANTDGMPGLGGPNKDDDSDAPDYMLDITAEQQDTSMYRDGATRGSFADDDMDGFADFDDPQVFAACFRPERDGVDNDGDGFVDEPGEMYVAAWDDDEDGRMDEDPPEFQLIVNLVDYIDQVVPSPINQDEDYLNAIGKNESDLVLADGVTERLFFNGISSSRQRALQLHSRSFSGAEVQGAQTQRMEEDNRFLLPNPPEITNPTRYRGVEAVRINEVMAKPLIRLEAAEAIQTSDLISANGQWISKRQLTGDGFSLGSSAGVDDNGPLTFDVGTIGLDPDAYSFTVEDTNWGSTDSTQFLYRGFQGTIHPFLPAPGLFDALAPNVIFAVTNVIPGTQPETLPDLGSNSEVATWRFTGIPAGIYDFALFLGPFEKMEPEVRYLFNGTEIPLRSDTEIMATNAGGLYPGGGEDLSDPLAEADTQTAPYDPFYGPYAAPGIFDLEQNYAATLRGFMPQLPPNYVITSGNGGVTTPLQSYNQRDITTQPGVKNTRSELLLPYRLTPLYPNQESMRIEVGNDGVLEVTIVALRPSDTGAERERGYYTTSFDRIELFDLTRQYVELVNLSADDIDMEGWSVETPFGKYVIGSDQRGAVLPRIKPLFVDDDGDHVVDGLPAGSAPYEHQLMRRKADGSYGSSTNPNPELEDNHLLLVADRDAFTEHLKKDYPDTPSKYHNLQDRVLELEQTDVEAQDWDQKLARNTFNPAMSYPYADTRFKLVDRESDLLSDNREVKLIRLYDPAGNMVDEFRYQTSFNNLVVNIPGNHAAYASPRDRLIYAETEGVVGGLSVPGSLDIIAVPGYRGMETSERADPTEVISEQRVAEPDAVPGIDEGTVYGDRFTPSYRLLARDAYIETDVRASLPGSRGSFMTYNFDSDFGFEDIPGFEGTQIPSGNYSPGADRSTVDRPPQGGWDFVGDAPDPGAFAATTTRKYKGQVVTPFPARLPEAGPMLAGDEWPSDSDSEAELRLKGRGLNFRQALFHSGLGGYENYQPRDPMLLYSGGAVEGDIVAFTWELGIRELVRAGFDPDTEDIINIRVYGRNHFVNSSASGGPALYETEIPLPVGEVAIRYAYGSQWVDFDTFAKLRSGDSAGTIDLSEIADGASSNSAYSTDLESSSGDEPTVKLQLLFRKTTPDFVDQLADNYYFHHIEISGRGRKSDVNGGEAGRYRATIAGTPLRDNTGYIPGSARRRFAIGSTSQRDPDDIIDNTPFVKNGRLASLGEISRIMTGKRFETVNTPLISQRLEDLTVTTDGSPNPRSVGELAQAGGGANSGSLRERLTLAQLERLDQYENQYSNLYNMVTTMPDIYTGGLININTAPREVLMALPAYPLGTGTEPEIETSLPDRMNFNAVVADYILEGRRPEGRDGGFGVQGVDDDDQGSTGDEFSEYRLWTVGREKRDWKTFADNAVESVFRDSDLRPESVEGTQVDTGNTGAATVVSRPDDGPYEDIGRLLSEVTHLRRRDRLAQQLRRGLDRTMDGKPDMPGDLRDRLNGNGSRVQLSEPLTPEDMERMMHRISNLITVRSRVFSIMTRGRSFASGEVAAQRDLETVYRK